MLVSITGWGLKNTPIKHRLDSVRIAGDFKWIFSRGYI